MNRKEMKEWKKIRLSPYAMDRIEKLGRPVKSILFTGGALNIAASMIGMRWNPTFTTFNAFLFVVGAVCLLALSLYYERVMHWRGVIYIENARDFELGERIDAEIRRFCNRGDWSVAKQEFREGGPFTPVRFDLRITGFQIGVVGESLNARTFFISSGGSVCTTSTTAKVPCGSDDDSLGRFGALLLKNEEGRMVWALVPASDEAERTFKRVLEAAMSHVRQETHAWTSLRCVDSRALLYPTYPLGCRQAVDRILLEVERPLELRSRVVLYGFKLGLNVILATAVTIDGKDFVILPTGTLDAFAGVLTRLLCQGSESDVPESAGSDASSLRSCTV